ncbi:MAG: ribosome recycling factor [Roseiflexaceae bacterium]|nr:ribosome recycling factor [Roseiflexaceae bacterium]
MTISDIQRETEGKMKKTVESLRHHLSGIRTGRASPALVEDLQVEVYGSMMPLNQLAGIGVPEAKQILIQPYDTSTLKAIEKAIQNSELGLNPSNDGRIIRLVLPPLTQERRKDLVKQVKGRVEESKIAMRNLRRDGLEEVKKLMSDKQISEDEQRRGQEKLQQLTDSYIKELDGVGVTKEQEILEV